jgi:hypothetical protein
MNESQKPKFKRYEIKVAIRYGEGQTHWKTIGSVFTSPDTHLVGNNNKPASFVLDWPEAQGIIVPVKEKDDKNKNTSNNDLPSDDANDNG